MIKFLLLGYLLIISCQNCEDKNFQKKFVKTINTLHLFVSNGLNETNNLDSVKIAGRMLYTLTNIKAGISYNYTIIYERKTFTMDSIKWTKWYEKNKCKMTESMFDSVYLKVHRDFYLNKNL